METPQRLTTLAYANLGAEQAPQTRVVVDRLAGATRFIDPPLAKSEVARREVTGLAAPGDRDGHPGCALVHCLSCSAGARGDRDVCCWRFDGIARPQESYSVFAPSDDR